MVGTTGDGVIVWPLAGRYARIRGDLDRADMAAIAGRTTVVSGRPVVRPPTGYRVVSTTPYRPPVVREIRYVSIEVGQEHALGRGLTYTGVLAGGGFEDQLYDQYGVRTGTVHGHPAVVSPVMGGNATLAWEPAAGIVAYVGYSGSAFDADAVAALQCLANQSRGLSTNQWQATHPAIVNQINDPR